MTTREDDRWLLPFLAELRPRAAMRTGDYRVESLECYMSGYVQARWDCGRVGMHPDDRAVLDDFAVWLAARANEDLGNQGWCWFVRQVDPGARSVETFFRLFEEYLQSTGASLDYAEPWEFYSTLAQGGS